MPGRPIEIDLCESSYDTKLYVYENAVTPGNPYVCNDDFGDCINLYRSKLEVVPVTAGNTYYIVVDGYGSDMGDYILYLYEIPIPPFPCELECPIGGDHEGEPELVDEYIDAWNGGCGSSPYAFQSIDWPITCGISGWYSFQGASYRDTDWFTTASTEDGYITASCVAEYDVFLFVLLPVDCGSVGVVYDVVCTCEIPGVIEFDHPGGAEVWLWVGPTEFSGPVYEFDYLLEVLGVPYVTATDDVSWGEVKNMFR